MGFAVMRPSMAKASLLRLAGDEARGLSLRQERDCAADEVERENRFLVVAARLLFQRVDALLQAIEIGEHQFGFDRSSVGDRIDLALDVGDVAVLEAAQYVRDRVDLADMGEELVAEALALRGAAHEAGDVDEGEPGRNDRVGMRDFRERLQARIGHRHLAEIGLDGAERIIRRLRGGGLRQSVEERGLADIRQADDAALESMIDLRVRLGRGPVIGGLRDAARLQGKMNAVLEFLGPPFTRNSAASATASQTASTQPCSSLKKSEST